MAVRILICLLAGYLLGTISTGYIVGKIKGVDIREYGSGNAGTTNAFRVLGRKCGIITFIGDFTKAFLPIVLIRFVIWPERPDAMLLAMLYGFGCVIGHNYPVWLKFKGGKGIAVTGGVFVAIDPWILIPGWLLFGGCVFFTKYVSVGSLVIAVLFPIWLAIRLAGTPYYAWILVVAVCYTISAFYRHRANIKRLMNGTENKIGQKVQISTETK